MAEGKQDAQEIANRLASDPSILTTQALHREIAVLKEQFNTQIDGIVRAFKERLDAIDKATQVFSENLVRVPTETDKSVGRLRDLHESRFDGVGIQIGLLEKLFVEKITALEQLHEGKFTGIQAQFHERDIRFEQASVNAKNALDSAFVASKEAVIEQNKAASLAITKLEAATDKRIDSIHGLLTTTTHATESKISDIKDRLVRIEGQNLGQTSAKSEQHTSSSFVVGLVAVGIAIISAVIAALALMR